MRLPVQRREKPTTDYGIASQIVSKKIHSPQGCCVSALPMQYLGRDIVSYRQATVLPELGKHKGFPYEPAYAKHSVRPAISGSLRAACRPYMRLLLSWFFNCRAQHPPLRVSIVDPVFAFRASQLLSARPKNSHHDG